MTGSLDDAPTLARLDDDEPAPLLPPLRLRPGLFAETDRPAPWLFRRLCFRETGFRRNGGGPDLESSEKETRFCLVGGSSPSLELTRFTDSVSLDEGLITFPSASSSTCSLSPVADDPVVSVSWTSQQRDLVSVLSS